MNRLSVDTKTIHIRGMFCVHCEETIRKALLALPGVESADVSWEKEIAVVTVDPSLWDDGLIRKTIEDAGYEVIPSGESRIQIASILVILLALWVIANHLGWTQVFNLFPRIETSLSIGALFLTGLLTSVHCLAMCGGINLTQSVMASSQKQKILRSNVLYHTGRVLSYTLIGAIAGGIGSVLSLSGIFKGFVAVTAGIAMLVMALNMLGVFRFLRKLRPKFSGKTHASLFARIKSGSSFLIGLLNGLMPCGPLQAMQLYALSTGSILQGALSMLAFSLGTVPLMFGFGLISGKLNRKYSRVMLTVSAMLIFVMGLNMLGNGLALSGVSLPQRNASAVIQAMQDEGVQTLRTEIDYGSYPAVRVRAGIPVDWTIIVPEGKLNGCNGEILISAYQIDVVLQEGVNSISFLPEQPGTISYSCWMGMIRSTIEITELRRDKRMIYLDYTAHMPASKPALDAFLETENHCLGNANAHHDAGTAANQRMKDAQHQIAGLLQVKPEELIFTSGASESNNTAIQGIVYANRHFGRHIVTSPLEHPSVSGCLTALQERGYEIDVLPLNSNGQISLEALQQALRPDTVLVTLCAVDSELGSVQQVEKAAQIIKSFPHCRLHMDVTQAIGKINVPFSCVDTASLSAHKFGGITGSGLLYKKKDTEMEPLIHGGVSTSLYRSGSPAVSLAASLAAALQETLTEFEDRLRKVQALNQYLRDELTKRNVRIHSPKDAIPHILNVGIDGIKGYEIRDRLNAHGVCVSVKSACSVENTPSRAVYAVTGNRRQALESWRISLSHLTTMEELNDFLGILDLILEDKRK